MSYPDVLDPEKIHFNKPPYLGFGRRREQSLRETMDDDQLSALVDDYLSGNPVQGRYETMVKEFLKEMKVGLIQVQTVEFDCVIQVIVATMEGEVKIKKFEGTTGELTLDVFIKAFDYVMEIVVSCKVSDCLLKIDPYLFPQGLLLADLPFRTKAREIVQLEEINWSLGAPLKLFVQIKADKVTVDTSLHDNVDGMEIINSQIQEFNVIANN